METSGKSGNRLREFQTKICGADFPMNTIVRPLSGNWRTSDAPLVPLTQEVEFKIVRRNPPLAADAERGQFSCGYAFAYRLWINRQPVGHLFDRQ